VPKKAFDQFGVTERARWPWANLDQLLDKALAVPGVAAIIKPTVDAIRAKLDTLTKV
jgi:hypothetical protein